MTCIVKKAVYFVLDIPNRPGEAARVLGTLADAGVNLLAFTGFPRGRKAQIDLIPEDAALCEKALKAAKLETRPQKTVFLVHGENRKGAVAEVLKILAEKEINVTAIDAIASGAGRYGAMLWVDPNDVNRAARALAEIH